MMNIDVPDVEMDEMYEDGEREVFPPDEFEAEEERPAPVNSSDDEGEPQEKKVKSKSAAKKVVRNPQAKLDDMRLCGQRGIPLLPKTFKDVKFKGKGHEVQDLDLYLSKMEHWAHRMFPKMVFDEVIERCDRLYKTKKLVKTTLIRMRNDDDLLDDNADDVAREGDDGGDVDDLDEMIPADAAILSSTRPLAASMAPPSPTALTTPTATPVVPPTAPVQINDEIRERIERNKRIAMEKRLARMQALQEQNSEETTVNVSSTAATADPATNVATTASVEATEAPPRSVHSLPAVVSKSATPSVISARQETVGDQTAQVTDESTDGNAQQRSDASKTGDPQQTDATLPSRKDSSPSADADSEATAFVDDAIERDSSNSATAAEGLSKADPAHSETDLDEDELLKLINE